MTDPTTTDDYRAILRTILEDPADDLPRLVLADYLDDHADEPHRHDYAEYVRVSCELARLMALPCSYAAGTWESEGDPMLSGGKPMVAWPNSPPARCVMPRSAVFGGGLCHKCAGIEAEARRERELFDAHEHLWSAPWRTREEVLTGSPNGCCNRQVTGLSCRCLEDAPDFTWSRGFVSAVTLSQASFVGGPCVKGHGAMLYFTPGATLGGVEVSSKRCPTCDGTGRTPGLAAALFAAHPIESVTLSDCVPMWDGRIGGYFWANSHNANSEHSMSARLHPALFNRLPDAGFAGFATPAAARDALSRQAIAYGRHAAGLTPLPAPADAPAAIRGLNVAGETNATA